MKSVKLLSLSLATLVFISSCKKDDDPVTPATPAPVAAFTVDSGQDIAAPTNITFTNTSTNSATYSWNFGDGTPVTTDVTPTVTHTYQQPGSYVVTLTAINAAGATATKTQTVVVKSRMEAISAKPYKLTAWTITNNGQTSSFMGFLETCELDDLNYFRANGVYQITDGANVCPVSSAVTGTWAFSNNFSKISVIESNDTTVFDIVSLSTSELKLRMEDPFFGTNNFTLTAQP